MRITTRNMFNWLIITMMVLVPLRAVNASVQSTCDTQQHQLSSHAMHNLSMHTMHHMHHDQLPEVADQGDCCCCDGDTQCTTDCGIGSPVSGLMHKPITVPPLNAVIQRVQFDDSLVFREQAPPTRPPAYL